MSVLLGIVSRNRKDLLVKAITSGLSQQGVDISVSVIDDASTDGTESLKMVYPLVSWTLQKEARGYLVGRNQLMSTANQKYYCSLDDDSWFLQDDCLKQAVDVMERDPSVACIAFDILSPDRKVGVQRSAPIEWANYIGCGHLLRLSAVRSAGYYNPNPLKYGGEEKDMCMGLLDLGYKIKFLPGVNVWHEKSSVGRDMVKQHAESLCNDLVITFRRAPWVILLPALIFKIGSHGLFALRYEKGKYFPAFRFGLIQFVRAAVTFQLDRKPVRFGTYLLFFRILRLTQPPK